MKTFTNQNPGTVDEAIGFVRTAREDGHSVSFAGGGTDLLQLVKERVVNRSGQDVPDVLVNLKSLEGVDQVSFNSLGGVAIGGLTTLSNLANNSRISDDYKVLAVSIDKDGEVHAFHLKTGTQLAVPPFDFEEKILTFQTPFFSSTDRISLE